MYTDQVECVCRENGDSGLWGVVGVAELAWIVTVKLGIFLSEGGFWFSLGVVCVEKMGVLMRREGWRGIVWRLGRVKCGWYQ